MEEERNYTVYMHVNKVNGKTYVGITSAKPQRRWRNDGSGYIGCEYFYRAIQKYGWDNFEHIILFKNKTKEEAEQLEVLFIKILLSNNRIYGYNISGGGNSTGKISEETKLKISKAKKGKKLSEEARKSMTEKRKKYIHPSSKKVFCDGKLFNSGKECAEYYNISSYKMLNSWLRGRDGMPQEYFDMGLSYVGERDKVKLRIEQVGGNNSNAKKVICEGIIYDTLLEIANKYKFSNSIMSEWLNGKKPMPQNFIDLGLRYVDSDIIFQPQKGHKGGNNPIAKKVICDGVIYDCIGDCAKYYEVNRRQMNDWLLKNRMPQKFVDLGLKYLEDDLNDDVVSFLQISTKGGRNPRAKKVICDGKIFGCIKDCADYYNINHGTMRGWLNGNSNMRKEFIKLGLKYYIEENENEQQSA